MKTKISHVLSTKMATTMLAFVMFMFGVLLWNTSTVEMYAAEADYISWDEDTYDDYAVAEYSTEIARGYVQSSAPEVDGYVFAGWYKSSECKLEQVVKSKSEILDEETCYAKFVSEDVLSTKVQISNGDANPDTETPEKNMRFVSSVDNLAYTQIGFRMKYLDENDNWIYKINKGQVVFERIVSATAGDEYKFSPKVVDTKSEYFMTATWKGEENTGIEENDFDTDYYVRAYWVTLDGVRVYGPTRYVSVNDGLNANIVNVSVEDKAGKWAEVDEQTGLKASFIGSDGAAKSDVPVKLALHDGTYAHLKINLGDGVNRKTALSSATMITISDGTNKKYPIYRNLYTTHVKTDSSDVNADTTWYQTYFDQNNAEDEFVIATSADLYGLEYLANYNGGKDKITFDDLKIYMVSDITVNEGTASVESGWVPKESGSSPYKWYAARGFAGLFDGQNHVISGLYGAFTSDSTSKHYTQGMGFLTETVGATIQDISIVNSFYDVKTSGGTGAIVGLGSGTFQNLYSDIVMLDTSSKGCIGGIVGKANGVVSVNNCWSDSYISTDKAYNGGIVGNASGKEVAVKHCLNTGTFTYTGTSNAYAGGIVGRGDGSGTVLTIQDCLNLGTIEGVSSETRLGSILGTAAATGITIEKAYTVENVKIDGMTILPEVGNDARTEQTGTETLTYQELYDMNAFCHADLSYEGYVADGYWSIRDDNTPMLVSFLDQADKTIGVAGRSKTEFKIVDGVGYISVLSQLESFRDQQNAGTLELANGEKAVMTDDIEVNENADATGWADGTETVPTSWTAIKNFAGTFDGQGYTISGIYGNQVTGQTGTGLFTQTDGATIQNLNVTNSYFLLNTTNGTGGVVGCGSGTFKTIYTDVIMSDTDSTPRGYAGGIVGKATGAVTMENCWSNSTIDTRHQYVGGLIGYCKDQILTISHCLNTGKLTHHYTTNTTYKTNCYMGGLLGYSNTTLNITDSMTSGIVQSKDSEEAGTTKELTNIYATVGSIAGTMSTISNTYGVINHDESGNALGMTTSYTSRITLHDDTAVLADNTVLGLDYVSADNTDGYWTMRTNRMPALTSFLDLHNAIDDEEEAKNTFVLTDNKGTISNAEQLASFRDQMNAGTLSVDSSTVVTLANDIVVNADADMAAWAEGTKETPTAWIPISGFSGTFDGGGYTISGLYSNVNYKIDTTSYGTGLFTNTNGATIKNLKISNSYFEVSTSEGTGPVIGKGTGTIKNVYTDVIIVDENTSTKGRIGGIIGKANGDVTIENCWSNSRIESKWTYIGGIVGYSNAKNVTISHCLNTGTLTYTGEADSYFGGIVGSSCSTTATSYAGLLQITDCLNVGTVSGASAQTFMGGVIGNAGGLNADSEATVVITNSYASINLDESNNSVGTTITVGNNLGAELTNCESVAYANLLGELAYSSTNLDFITDSVTTGYWMARENDTPILKDFF